MEYPMFQHSPVATQWKLFQLTLVAFEQECFSSSAILLYYFIIQISAYHIQLHVCMVTEKNVLKSDRFTPCINKEGMSHMPASGW